MWFLDGTFKSCPPQFSQIYTINGVYEGVGFPFVYALLPGKAQFLYETFFRMIKDAAVDNGINLNPNVMMFDFERAALNAAKQEFPNADIHACHFHLASNLNKRVQNEGLAAIYRDSEEISLGVKKLLALSFLPPGEVPEAFCRLKEAAPQELEPLYKYFEETYVLGKPIIRRGKGRRPITPRRNRPLFEPSLWNVHHLQNLGFSRTNNHQEGWHHRFNVIVGGAHRGVFPLIVEFIKEEHRVSQEVSRYDHGQVQKKTVSRHTAAR